MKKSWIIGGAALILIAVAGIAAYGFRTGDDLKPVEKTWSFQADALRRLQINSDYDVSITFVCSSDGNNSIRLVGEGTETMVADTLVTEIENGALTLDLRQKPQRWFYLFDSDSFNAEENLTISLADGVRLDALDLDLGSGDVTIKGAELAAIDSTNVKTGSGNVTLDRFKSGQLEVDVGSGNVTANGLMATVVVTAGSGNIRLNDVTGTVNLKVGSGNVRLYKLTNAETNIVAGSGDVNVQVPSSFAGFYDLRAGSGSVSAPDPKRKTTDYVKVRTDSGDIKVEQQ